MVDKLLIAVFLSVFAGGLFLQTSPFLGVLLLLLAGLLFYFRGQPKTVVPQKKEEGFDEPPEFVAEEVVDGTTDTTMKALTKEYKRKIRSETEQAILDALNNLLDLLRGLIPHHTAAFFRRGSGEEIFLFLYHSDSGNILLGKPISRGSGLVGQVMKDKSGRVVSEGDLRSASTTLLYYSADEGIRSFLGVPIVVDGLCRGALIVDSLEANAFDEAARARVELCARLAGAIQFYAYLQIENKIDRNKAAALSALQRDFFKLGSEHEIITKLGDILDTLIPSDRVTLSLLDNKKGFGRVCHAKGAEADFFKEYVFPFSEKGLISLVLEKNSPLKRKFEPGKVTPRFSVREKVNPDLQSILAVPIPASDSDHAIGVIALESLSAGHYSQMDLENVQNLANATGLALEKIRMLEAQTHLATMDGLTGLPNHRQFQNALDAYFKRARRQNSELAIIMSDIDYFKKINDTYGHPVGDLILKGVAELLRGLVRKDVDMVARYGGEEFSCIIESGESMALESAERIRSAVEKTAFDIGAGKKLNITMSFGVAVFPADASKKSLLLERADKALYEAKKAGRNQVRKY